MADCKVLVIEPDRAASRTWEEVLRFLDYVPIIVPDVDSVDWFAPKQDDWIAILLGQSASTGALQNFLTHLRSHDPQLPLVRIGAPDMADEMFGDLRCLQMELPVRYPQLSSVLQRAQELRLGAPAAAHKVPLPNIPPPPVSPAPVSRRNESAAYRPAGRSRAIEEVNRLIEKVAPFEANVLVLGESGTGKEMVARHIHERSARAAGPFVPLNCGAIPADLLESELFGHERGAFTGALSARSGRFEFAEGGTLFLDEIGDMSLQMQVKLLRVLQERTFERIGSNRSVRCDVRIVAATHRDLEAGIREGWFRQDLYYRLNVFPIQMPPLRERLQDLPLLVEDLSVRARRERGSAATLDLSALAALATYSWPGNVRELANLLERLSILHAGRRIGLGDLPERYRSGVAPMMVEEPAGDLLSPADAVCLEEGPAAVAAADGASAVASADIPWPVDGLDLKDHLASIELALIRRALSESDGTIAVAARLLRMNRTTLVEKMRKHGL